MASDSDFYATRNSSPLSKARRLLDVTPQHTRTQIIKAFREKAHACHPDKGGNGEAFQRLVAARELLLRHAA